VDPEAERDAAGAGFDFESSDNRRSSRSSGTVSSQRPSTITARSESWRCTTALGLALRFRYFTVSGLPPKNHASCRAVSRAARGSGG
jgi:hypothetical protein